MVQIHMNQCPKCSHLILEKYVFDEPTKEGNIGFAWCGFCRTKHWQKADKALAKAGAVLKGDCNGRF